ncbi:MAG: class I SAM-dependent methyltransferase [Candidatus Promineifilaceae bacterium]|nr:class I SAM-dependent methyltransferase [Candidatus Promineifilaceae bacterium]
MNHPAARAYDAIAADYDRQVAGDAWVRRQLRQHYLRIFTPGARILDVGCGTGLETLFLARQGMVVTGLDVSPGMLAHLRTKAGARGLSAQITLVEGGTMRLADCPRATFDGIISTFAVLNTVADLHPFAANAAGLLRPEGRLIIHLLNRFSVWEWIRALRHGPVAPSRFSHSQRTFIVGGEPLLHHLYTADEAYRRFFAPHFVLCERYGMGVLRPPPTLRFASGSGVALVGRLERWLRRYRPFCNWGRFFVLDLQKRPRAAS